MVWTFLTAYIRARNGRHGHRLYQLRQASICLMRKYELDMRPDRARVSVPGLPTVHQSLYPSPVKSKRDAGHASVRACTTCISIIR